MGGSGALRLCCLLQPRRPSSLSGSASRMALIRESVFLLAGGLPEGTAPLITLAQRSSTDLFVNAQAGQVFLRGGQHQESRGAC